MEHAHSVGEAFHLAAERWPESYAVLHPDRRSLTYAELGQQIDYVRRRLCSHGIAATDRVGVAMSHNADQGIANLATACAAIAAPISTQQTETEIRARLGRLELGALITDDRSLAAIAAADFGIPVFAATFDAGAAPGLFRIPRGTGPAAVADVGSAGAGFAVISSTSGTTSAPKLVPVSHGNILARARCSVDRFALTPDDRLLNPMRYVSGYSLYTGLMGVLISGGSVIEIEHFDAELFVGLAARFGATWSIAGPTLLRSLTLWLDADRNALRRHRLRLIRAGTGHLPVEVASRLERRLGIPVLTGYGLEEAGEVACNPLPPAPRKPGSVGTPSQDLRIVDPSGNDVDRSSPGEVLVRGEQVFRGHLNSQQSNSDRFTDDGWLRTGDEGFLDADGYLTITGRFKDLINRGGQSISPFEVEDVLLAHPEVDEAVCFSVPHRSLGEDIAAAVVLRAGADATGDELIEHVAAHLSHAKVPCAVIPVPELVKNENGKVSRQRLSTELSDVVSRRSSNSTRPATEVECLVASHWVGVLGVEDASRDDDFFRVGGDSLAATALMVRLAGALDHDLDHAAPFSHRTLKSLSAYIETVISSERGRRRSVIATHAGATAPLSRQQHILWFLSLMNPQSLAYNVGSTVQLTGKLDVAALSDSLGAMIYRHEALRTCFPEVNGHAVQKILAPFVPECPIDDIGARTAAREDRALRDICDREMNEPFDLSTGPLFRCRIVSHSDERHTLIMVKHHIISDLWSNEILINELTEVYDAALRGELPHLEKPERRYVDYAGWQQSELDAGRLNSQQTYWESQLRNAPPQSRFMTDREASDRPRFQGGHVDCSFPPGLEESLKGVARKYEVTPYMVLLTALSVLLHRHTGQDDLVIGSPFANRPRAELANVVGLFVNTVPIRIDLSDGPTLPELLAQVRKTLIAAQRNSEFPFEKIVESVNPSRVPGRNPLFQVMLIFGSVPSARSTGSGLEVAPGPMLSAGSMFDIELYIWSSTAGLAGRWDYDADLYDGSTVTGLQTQLEALLTAIIEDPSQRISAFDIVPAFEWRRVVQEWNQTERSYPLHKTIHQLFEERATSCPESVALIDGDRRASLGELDRRANRMANHLLASGVQPGCRVGLLVDRSINAVAALLAVLKCGAAFVPIDPSTPSLRVNRMATICDMRFCIIGPNHIDALHGASSPEVQSQPLACIELQSPAIDKQASSPPGIACSGDAEAYVLFTSGSTGEPKAVASSHRGMVNLVHWLWEAFPYLPGEVCCHRSRLSFIDALWELLAPLLAGIPTVIVPDEVVLDPDRFADCLSAHKISRVVLVPSLLELLMSELPGLPGRAPSVSTWFVGGEELPIDLSRRFLNAFAGARLVNLYGQTEVAGVATSAVYTDSVDLQTATRTSIGRPVANTRVYVLDPDLRPCPVGVKGELFVGGCGVANGYAGSAGDPFVSVALGHGESRDLYRTGDMGRWSACGSLEYLGRCDRQVKVRGMRIALDEIEAAVSASPAVADCAVVIIGDGVDRRLRAFFSARGDERIRPSQMNEWLGAQLPKYMAVNEWYQLDELPRTATGKLDYPHLSTPGWERQAENGGIEPAETELERRMLDVWRNVLGLAEIGLQENFFDLGGHSLLAVRLLSEIEREVGRKLELIDLYRRPSIGQLARVLENAPVATSARASLSPIVPINPGSESTPLFCAYGLFIYAKLAKRFGADQPTYGVYGRAETELLMDPTPELESSFPGIPELAAEYLVQVRSVQPYGPYQLVGESFGGLIAYEMALQLADAGERVSLLAVLDMPTPAVFKQKLVRWRRAAGTTDEGVGSEDLIGKYAGIESVSDESSLRGKDTISRVRKRAIADYEPKPYPGNVVLFRSEESRGNLAFFGDEWLGWRTLVGERLTVHDLPGGHIEILEEPHVRVLAEKLRPYLLRGSPQ